MEHSIINCILITGLPWTSTSHLYLVELLHYGTDTPGIYDFVMRPKLLVVIGIINNHHRDVYRICF